MHVVLFEHIRQVESKYGTLNSGPAEILQKNVPFQNGNNEAMGFSKELATILYYAFSCFEFCVIPLSWGAAALSPQAAFFSRTRPLMESLLFLHTML